MNRRYGSQPPKPGGGRPLSPAIVCIMQVQMTEQTSTSRERTSLVSFLRPFSEITPWMGIRHYGTYGLMSNLVELATTSAARISVGKAVARLVSLVSVGFKA